MAKEQRSVRPDRVARGDRGVSHARSPSALKRGEISLESGERSLHLSPASDVKLELRVGAEGAQGAIELEIGWKRSTATKTSELRVAVGPPPEPRVALAPAREAIPDQRRSVTSVLREDLGQDLAMMARLVQSQLIRR